MGDDSLRSWTSRNIASAKRSGTFQVRSEPGFALLPELTEFDDCVPKWTTRKNLRKKRLAKELTVEIESMEKCITLLNVSLLLLRKK